MKNLIIRLATSVALVVSAHVVTAQTPPAPKLEASKTSADMADGEVRKIDKENKKITLKHGPIKSLDMPGMTMVFQVKNAALLDTVKAGDKIKFKAEQAGSAIMVTDIVPAK